MSRGSDVKNSGDVNQRGAANENAAVKKRGAVKRRKSVNPRSTTLSYVLINALWVAGASAIAAWTLYPVYESARFVTVMAVAILGGAAIAVVCDRLRWGAGRAALLAAGLYVVAGPTLAIPGATSGVSSIGEAALELVRGPVTGWKDIVTLPLPLGEYRATLVPVLALFLTATLVGTWAAIRAPRWWALAGVTMAALVVASVTIGPATRADELSWAPFGRYASREFIVGLVTFAWILGWLSWRAFYARRRAIATAFGTTGVRLKTSSHTRTLGGAAAALTMIAVAVGASLLVSAPIASSTPRDVVRTAIEPRTVVDTEISPLTTFRNYFDDEQYDTVLFTVSVGEGAPDRVRVATLPYFDGDEYSASAPEGTPPAHFQRLPSRIDVEGNTQDVNATVTIGTSTGVWVPIVGELGSVTFQGARRSLLVDTFYYLPDAATGVVVADGGLAVGDTYVIDGVVMADLPALAELGQPSGIESVDRSLIPESLSAWVARQQVTQDGAGLAELVTRLRERGYLSHSIDESDASDDAAGPAWQAELPRYAFAPSAAGHSFDRIDRLFTQLNDREDEVGNATATSLVAAVGDDEQFAVATSLMAAELGFPSRVVLGAHLADTDEAGWAAPACEAGECRGKNMAVWTEVQADDGRWVPIEVSPQFESPLSPDVTNQRDPEFASALDPQRAEPIVPPSTQRGTSSDDDPAVEELEEGWLWLAPALRIAGISALALLILVGPLVGILIWKATRRRKRRKGQPADAMYQGWDEYLDTAVDSGLAPLPLATRVEVAREYGTQNGARLADLTDRTTFGGVAVDENDAAEFWALVEADRQAWLAERSWWARTKMRLSLRSVWSSLAPAPAPPKARDTAGKTQWRTEHTLVTASHRHHTGAATSRRRKKK